MDFGQSQTPVPHHSGEWDQFTRQAAIVILLLAVLILIYILRPLLNLLGVTGIFILILSYPVNKLRTKTNLAYSVSVFVVFIPIAIIVFLLLGNAIQWVVGSAQSVINEVGGNIELTGSFRAFMKQFPESGGLIRDILLKLAEVIGRELSVAMTFVALTITSFFLAFLFILEMPQNFATSFRSLSNVSQHEFGILFGRLSNVWNGWLRSTVITSIIIGASTALELLLFGIPNAGAMGVTAGLLNLIPTFGAFVAYMLIIVMTYTQGSTYLPLSPVTLCVLVLLINVFINQVIRLVIFPRLAGKAVHLPVFLVILGLVVAAVLWGVIGVILVVPLLGTAREILNYVTRKINRQVPYPGEEQAPSLFTQGIATCEAGAEKMRTVNASK